MGWLALPLPHRYSGADTDGKHIETALAQNVPFTLRMADGKKHRDYISLPPKGASLAVYDDEGRAFFLPLLTMTGLVNQSATPNATEPPLQ